MNPLFTEIGGNFWIDYSVKNETITSIPPHRYVNKYENKSYTSSGRGAIQLLLKSLHVHEKKVLLPIYTCESVIKPFIDNGYSVNFFEIENNLSISIQKLFILIEKTTPNLIYFQTYFGFDTLENIRPYYEKIKQKGIIIIEDITHSWLSSFNKAGPDFHVASLRKWLELPDGGVLISKDLINKTHDLIKTNNSIIEYIFIKASKLKSLYTSNLDENTKNKFRKLFYKIEHLLDEDNGIYNISNTSRYILTQTNLDELIIRRKNNFNYLLTNLKENNYITPVFSNLPENITPLYFPIRIECLRDKIQNFLASSHIYAPILWPIPGVIQEIENSHNPLYNQILALPCDQRYSFNHMDRIIETINAVPIS